MRNLQNQLIQRHHQIHSHWINQSKNDPFFGGTLFAHNLKIAKKVVQQFGGPKVMDVLNKTGLGSHPDIIRMMVRIGHALNQPSACNDNGKPQRQKTIAELFYPGFDEGRS